MLKRYMHNKEREHAMRDDNRIVRPFEWGTEYITDHANGDDPRKLFSEYSKNTVANSEEFFCSPEISDFKLNDDILTWTSGIATPTVENHTAYAKYFPHATDKKTAI